MKITTKTQPARAKKILLAMAIFWLFSSACPLPEPLTISIKSLDAIQPILKDLASEYCKKHPNVVIKVEGGGSHTAIRALNNGVIDIAVSCTPLTAATLHNFELRYSKTPVQIPLISECLAIYTHPKNPITQLNFEQIQQIYMGEVSNWKDLGGPNEQISPAPYSIDDFDENYIFFKKMFLNNETPNGRLEYLPTYNLMVNMIAKEPWSIGFGRAGLGEGIKKMPIYNPSVQKAFEPTAANALNTNYPACRNILLVLRESPQGEIKSFIDWLKVPANQQNFMQEGYYPAQ